MGVEGERRYVNELTLTLHIFVCVFLVGKRGKRYPRELRRLMGEEVESSGL